ncbi:MAG: tyrosine-type recombinase/integrase [Thiobacillaceae bacterium]
MASILKNSRGTWRVQIAYRGRRESKTFATKSMAQQWAKLRESELQRGLMACIDDAQKTSLSAVIERYRERVLPFKRNRSDRFTLDKLDRRFGRHPLLSLHSKDVADFRDDLIQAGKAPATVVKELNLLRVLIDFAITDMGIYMPANVARVVKNPRVRNARTRILSESEESQLFGAFTHPMLPYITQLALETACRLGELLNMQWEHVDLKRCTLHIPVTKTDVPRTVPLSPVAIRTFKKIPREAGVSKIFGCWARVDSFENVFRRAVKNAGLEDFRFHDLRHTATSRLAQKIPNVVELSLITGHTDLKMLSRYYHISAEDLAKKLR